MDFIDFAAAAPVSDPLDVHWIHGSTSAKHNTDPDIQVHAYDAHTFILRQNKAVHYEAPFLFLLFGNERAVLIDTGATTSPAFFPLRRTVDELVDGWLAAHPRRDYGLLVLHTHGHGDHVAGDGQFADRPDTVLVDAALLRVMDYFGFAGDHERIAAVDLGGRALECMLTPGHHAAAVAYFDAATGLLLTGDTVLRGRFYIEDWAAFGRTIDRLIAFCADRSVTHILGCHIEMTRTPGVDYPIRTIHQPDEPPLELPLSALADVRAALESVGDRRGRHAFPDFVICRDG